MEAYQRPGDKLAGEWRGGDELAGGRLYGELQEPLGLAEALGRNSQRGQGCCGQRHGPLLGGQHDQRAALVLQLRPKCFDGLGLGLKRQRLRRYDRGRDLERVGLKRRLLQLRRLRPDRSGRRAGCRRESHGADGLRVGQAAANMGWGGSLSVRQTGSKSSVHGLGFHGQQARCGGQGDCGIGRGVADWGGYLRDLRHPGWDLAHGQCGVRIDAGVDAHEALRGRPVRRRDSEARRASEHGEPGGSVVGRAEPGRCESGGRVG